MADQDQAVKQIDSVTDYVEEKEDNNLQSGLTSLVSSSTTISTPELKISREDIILISDELEISKEEAEKLLRSHGGVVKNVFTAYIFST